MSEIANNWDVVGATGLLIMMVSAVGGVIQGLVWLHNEVVTIPVSWLFLIGLVFFGIGLLLGE